MMNLSKIGWCDFSWNPVTGCKDNCSFCYEKNQATRLRGTVRINLGSPQIQKGPQKGLYILPKPFHNESGKVIAYPAGFAPTLHSHRLRMIADKKKPANIYVCSTGELFGEWMIVGCDTPLYRGDQPPSRAVLENILQRKGNRPLFMKDNALLRSIWNAPLVQEFPVLLQRAPDKPIPHCNSCRQCLIISERKRGNRHICRHRKVLKAHKNGRHVP